MANKKRSGKTAKGRQTLPPLTEDDLIRFEHWLTTGSSLASSLGPDFYSWFFDVSLAALAIPRLKKALTALTAGSPYSISLEAMEKD